MRINSCGILAPSGELKSYPSDRALLPGRGLSPGVIPMYITYPLANEFVAERAVSIFRSQGIQVTNPCPANHIVQVASAWILPHWPHPSEISQLYFGVHHAPGAIHVVRPIVSKKMKCALCKLVCKSVLYMEITCQISGGHQRVLSVA